MKLKKHLLIQACQVSKNLINFIKYFTFKMMRYGILTKERGKKYVL